MVADRPAGVLRQMRQAGDRPGTDGTGRRRTQSRVRSAVRLPVLWRHFATKPGLMGQKIRCSGCGAGVRVPAANSFPVEYTTRVALNAIAGSSSPNIAPVTRPGAGVSPPAGRAIPPVTRPARA